jgi:hypothetical protein
VLPVYRRLQLVIFRFFRLDGHIFIIVDKKFV